MAEQPLFARNGAMFVQVDGPNTQPVYVGCVDLDAISETGGGINTIVRCFNPDGQGWQTIGATLNPPEPVTASITTLAYKTQSALERIKSCPANFYVLQSETGRKDTFQNYVRAWIIGNGYINDRGASNIVMRETDEISTMTFGLTAFPPVLRVFKKSASLQSVALTSSVLGISFLNDVRCASSFSAAQGACKTGYLAGDAPTGSPSAAGDVFFTDDYGQTWTATAADPFAAAEAVGAVTSFLVGATTRRVVVARGTTDAGNPAEIAYSDNDGTTWSLVDVGETNGQFVQSGHGLFSLDLNNMWLVVNGGYIYFSADGGATWTVQSSGTATSEDLNAVHFSDNRVGFAVGDNDAILRTIDGGVSWGATDGDTGSADDILSVFTLDAQRAWIGTDGGDLFYTENAGVTWTQRRFSGDGSGTVRDIKFVNNLVGYMLHSTSGPVGRIFVTMDGGYSWELVTTPTNTGLNALAVCDENNFYAAGTPVNGTAALIKVQPAA